MSTPTRRQLAHRLRNLAEDRLMGREHWYPERRTADVVILTAAADALWAGHTATSRTGKKKR